jgi:hypothetical protein
MSWRALTVAAAGLACLTALFAPPVAGHGYLQTPASRNYYSRYVAVDWYTDTPQGGNGLGRQTGAGFAGPGIPDLSGGPFQASSRWQPE